METKILIFYSVIFTACIQYVSSANSTSGVCELEVPIASILPPELKHTAVTIRGNGTTPGFSKIKICCSGYKAGPRTAFNCIPDCPNGCGFGNCTAPNVCSCYRNATLGPDRKCISVCPQGCLNGRCIFNALISHQCNCNRGYTLDLSRKYCVLGCSRNCGPGGECVGNNQCKCSPGYQLNNQGVCSVYCDKGYQSIGTVCEPICSKPCVNATCTGPNRCTCNPGYTPSNVTSVCQPQCSWPCLNGECTAPNVCSCRQGYIKDPIDKRGTRCVAHCPSGCPNGICSAPNFCICDYGFVKQARGSNVCIKRKK